MKAATKAAKLRAKRERGRPRAEGPREPSGRVSRSGIDSEAPDKTAISVRVRMMGITEDQAKDQKAGSFIGYLNMIGPRDGLSDDQYEGALEYLRFRERLLRAIKSPAAIYDPEARGSGDGEISEAYEKWCKSTVQEWTALKQAIQGEQNYCRGNLWAALQYVVIEDKPMHHMIGETRLLCNVFARHFKTMQENRHAA
ncbi:hypothetical protein [Mesorhizobium sp. ESP-6-2]|uniref:hypothetical protein n=1 Tax=Mesorhizobium sp. ESP-6-2 TaxID=2876625 RepID=UPI001CCD64BE|nr:hypothetical protein [Mesorhizobium sp. ESP-6-2]MBZ9807679.1 hypothetical protein [Mesorhizobium sp. ESP-6-2]